MEKSISTQKTKSAKISYDIEAFIFLSILIFGFC